MDNLILTPKVFANMILMDLGRDLYVCKNMNHDVTPEFAKKNNKIGATVMVRKPPRLAVQEGLIYKSQPVIDTMTPVSVGRVRHVGYDWDSIEKTLSVRTGSEMNEKQLHGLHTFAHSAAIAIASAVNAEAATFCADNTFNSVGTPGTAPTTQATYLAAGDLLVAQGLPNEEQKNLTLIMNRRMSSAVINGTVGYFNPQNVISEQYVKGELTKRLWGYRLEQDQTINRHVNGTFAGTPLANQAAAQTSAGGNNGTISLVTDGWTGGTSNLKKGDVFTLGSATSATVGGVNSIHPQTKVDTGYQLQFTVLADVAESGGAMTILAAPAITPVSVDAQYANATVGAVDNAIITIVGTTGQTGDQGLLMHEQAFAFVSVPLEAPGEGMGSVVANVTDEDTGLSLQLLQAFEPRTHTHINGIWVLYDFGVLYRELAVKIQA